MSVICTCEFLMANRAYISTVVANRRFRRQAGKKPQRRVILIVCEGQTEEAYFRAVREYHGRAMPFNIEIKRAPHPDPVKVVEKGKEMNRDRDRDRDKGNDYDCVYCVVDGDKPDRIKQALKHIRLSDDLYLMVSTPCFEVWLLLHFDRSDAPLASCEQAIVRLQRHLPNYAKGLHYNFTPLADRMDVAIENAVWLAAQKLNNPATDLHLLLSIIRTVP